jgi:long-chain acyl-CoA synthetase
VPHPDFGETVVGVIVAEKGGQPDLDDIMGRVSISLARFKHPRIIDFHAALPREDSGKIFKPRLRAPYWENAGRKI